MVEHGSETKPSDVIKSASRSTRRRRPIYRNPLFWVQMLLVLGIIIGAWFSLRSAVREPTMAAPSHIGDLKRVSLVTGEAAMKQMRGLHGKDIGVVDGYLASYGSTGERMTLWVGMAGTEPDAEQLLERMFSGIDRGGTPFSAPVQVIVGGRQVFSTLGGGAMNYFFREAHSVVWVTLANSAMPANRLTDVLKTVNFE